MEKLIDSRYHKGVLIAEAVEVYNDNGTVDYVVRLYRVKDGEKELDAVLHNPQTAYEMFLEGAEIMLKLGRY